MTVSSPAMKNEISDLTAFKITSETAGTCIQRAKGCVLLAYTRRQVMTKERGNYKQGWGRDRLNEQQTDFALLSSFIRMATRLFLTSSASLNFCTFLYSLEKIFYRIISVYYKLALTVHNQLI